MQGRLGNARREARMAMLLDNYHPSSLFIVLFWYLLSVVDKLIEYSYRIVSYATDNLNCIDSV